MSYTPKLVERLCLNYIDYRHSLFGKASRCLEGYVNVCHPTSAERPLGFAKGESIPFREPKRASSPRNGKEKARQAQEVHVMMLDLEEGFTYLHDDDLEIIYKYLVFQTHTLDELKERFDITTRAGSSLRVQRAIERLTKVMNEPKGA